MTGALARDGALLLGSQVFYKATGLLLAAVLARLLGPHDLGQFFVAVAFAQGFLVLANGNAAPLVMRRVAQQPAGVTTQLEGLLGLRLVTVPVALSALAGATLVLQPMLWPGVMVVALFLVLEDVYAAFAAVFLAQERARVNVAIGLPVQVAFVAGAVAAIWLAPRWTSLVGVHLARGLVLAVVGWLVAGRPRPRRVRGFLDGAPPFFLLAVCGMLTEHVDALVLAAFVPYEAVGHFRLATNLVLAASFVPLGVGHVVFAALATGRGRALFVRTLTALVTLGALGGVVLAVIPDRIAAVLYGPLGPGVAPLLPLLAPLVPLLFAQVFLRAALHAQGGERGVLVAAAAGAVATVGLTLALVPGGGAPAAALARVVAAGLQTGVLGWIYVRRIDPRPTPR